MTRIEYPQRIRQALLPTRIERLSRYGARFPQVEVWIKRDDLTGFELSGNKVRKLEFSLARALGEGATGILTCGGLNSNHCRATTYLARRLGLSCHLFLRTATGKPPSTLQGNTLLDVIAGAEIRWVSPEAYQERGPAMQSYAEDKALSGERLFLVPEGASDGVGSFGFVRAAEELDEQLRAKNLNIDHVVHALGSGGTTAGLQAGRCLLRSRWQLWAMAVCDDANYFRTKIASIHGELQELGLDLSRVDLERGLQINDDYKGAGYGLTTPEDLRFLAGFAREEGILLDPTYTGKAFLGMHREIEKGTFADGSRILFWHTGGALGNFSYGEQWQSALAGDKGCSG